MVCLMRSVIRSTTADVLSNRGVPVQVHKVSEHDRRALDDGGGYEFTVLNVRFSAYALACIEDTYGGMEDYQKAMEAKPNRTLVDTLALIWGVTAPIVGEMMQDGAQNDYATAVATSLMLANGMEAEDALKVLQSGVRQATERQATMSAALDEALADAGLADEEESKKAAPAATRGTNGSGRGSRRVAVTTSSGG